MKKNILFIFPVILAAAAMLSCSKDNGWTIPEAPDSGGQSGNKPDHEPEWELVFSDDFEGTEMIEKIVLDYLQAALSVPVYMEIPQEPPDTFVLLEKKNGIPAPVLIGIAAAAAAGLIFMRARNGGTKAAGRRNTASAERSETRRRKREKAEEETQTFPKETGPDPQKSPAEPPASESCSRDPRKKESVGAERPDAEP